MSTPPIPRETLQLVLRLGPAATACARVFDLAYPGWSDEAIAAEPGGGAFLAARAGLAQAVARLTGDDAGDADSMAIVVAILGAVRTAAPVVQGSSPGVPEAENRDTVGELADAVLAARDALRRLFDLPLAAAAEAAGATPPQEIAP